MRARKTLGDGSDLGRIKRQQAFLSSVVQEATRTSLLLRPDKLFGFLDAATKSLTTDEQFDLGTMKDLASSVKDIGIKNIQFITVPVQGVPGRPQPGRLGAQRRGALADPARRRGGRREAHAPRHPARRRR